VRSAWSASLTDIAFWLFDGKLAVLVQGLAKATNLGEYYQHATAQQTKDDVLLGND
jgi:hypothetical protein